MIVGLYVGVESTHYLPQYIQWLEQFDCTVVFVGINDVDKENYDVLVVPSTHKTLFTAGSSSKMQHTIHELGSLKLEFLQKPVIVLGTSVALIGANSGVRVETVLMEPQCERKILVLQNPEPSTYRCMVESCCVIKDNPKLDILLVESTVGKAIKNADFSDFPIIGAIKENVFWLLTIPVLQVNHTNSIEFTQYGWRMGDICTNQIISDLLINSISDDGNESAVTEPA